MTKADAIAREIVAAGALYKHDERWLRFIARRISEAEARGYTAGFNAAKEEAAKWTTDGYKCSECDARFLGEEGHPEPPCVRPNWYGLTSEESAAVILGMKENG